MDTVKCRYLIAIAEQQSFSKAAAASFVSQPYLSRLVQETEAELGTRLFIREKTRVCLTRAGERYIDYCRDLIQMEKNMRSDLREFAEQKRGRIRIGISSSNGSYILPFALPEFCASYPDIEVSVSDGLREETMVDNLRSAVLDIAFFSRPVCPEDLDWQLIRQEPILLVLPPEHPAGIPEARGNYEEAPYFYRKDLEKLQHDPFIALHPEKGIGQIARDIFSRCGFAPRTVFTLNNVETAYRMAARGLGYTFIPQIAARYSAFETPPCYFRNSLDASELYCRTHIAAYRKEHRLGSVENALISCIRKYA